MQGCGKYGKNHVTVVKRFGISPGLFLLLLNLLWFWLIETEVRGLGCLLEKVMTFPILVICLNVSM